jgi:hypothetical protein
MSSEKREAIRVPVPQRVTGEVTVFQAMAIINLSANGAKIETSFPLHMNSMHDFRLSLGERSVVVKGRIVHCQIGELAPDGGPRYRTGVEFVEPSAHVAAAIEAFIESLQAPLPKIVDAEIAEEGS